MKATLPSGTLLPKNIHFLLQKPILYGVLILFFLNAATQQASGQDSMANKAQNDILSAIPKGGLKIGDSIPEALWHLPLQVVNHPEGKDTITLNDYRGKLIILDFWATWCGSCIAAMPKMHALQEQFGDSLTILSSTYETKETVKTFININQHLKSLHLFTIVNIGDFRSIFYHRLLPHYVWIDPEGTILTTSASSQVSKENIQITLKKSKNAIKPKIDLSTTDYPFLKGELLMGNSVPYFALLVKGSYDGLESGNGRSLDSAKNSIIIKVTNQPILGIYEFAVSNFFPTVANEPYGWDKRRLIEVSHPEIISLEYDGSGTDLPDSNFYSFIFSAPASHKDSIYKEMIDDLNRYSGYQGTIERRLVKCLVLIRTSNNDKIKSADTAEPVSSLFYGQERFGKLTNYPISKLADFLQGLKSLPLPVVDETNYTENIDIKLGLKASEATLPALRKELTGYGLDLVERERALYMFVLKDK